MRILIIGYGNTLRGDDAFGPRAAAALRREISGPEVEVLSAHQLTPELAEPVSQAARVIFLDAAVGDEPGRIAVTQLNPEAAESRFTHSATPGGLLASAQALYGKAAEGTLISVVGADFELGEGLSEPVERAMESVIETCKRLIGL